MESIISHNECLGFDASFGTCFLDQNIFCIRAGNFLQICSYNNQSSMEMIGTINGKLTGFSAMSATPIHHILAYSDDILNPQIHLCNSNGDETGSITVPDVYGLYDLEFSFDGEWLFSLGRYPTFRLSAFNYQQKTEVTFLTSELPIGQHISSCPMHPRMFATYGDVDDSYPSIPEELDDQKHSYLRFYTLCGSSNNYIFTEIISDVTDPVTSLCWSPQDHCFVGTTKGEILIVDPTTGKIINNPIKLGNLGEGEQTPTALLCVGSYLLVSGTSGSLYWLPFDDLYKTQELFVVDTNSSLLFLLIFPNTNILIFGTQKNSLICSEISTEGNEFKQTTMISLRDTHKGAITSAVCLPHNLITAGIDGTLRIWSFTPYLSLLQTLSFGNDSLTSLSSSTGGNLLVVGSKSGVLRIINMFDPAQPILLYRERLHNDAITSIVVTTNYIISGSICGTIVIIKTDPLKLFPLIGLIKLKTSIVSLSSPPPLGEVQQLLIATGHKEIIRIDIPNESTTTENFLISIDSLNQAILKVSNNITCIVSESQLREEQQYFYCGCDDKTVKYYCMPITSNELDIVGFNESEPSAPDDIFLGHIKPISSIAISPSQRFVASGCTGSTLILREIDVSTAQVKSVLLNVINHYPKNGSISNVLFSPDEKKLFSVGYDGSINMYSLKVNSSPIISDHFQFPKGAFKISVSRVYEIEQQIRTISEIWNDREYDTNTEEDGFQADDGSGYEETALINQIKLENRKLQITETEEFQNEIKQKLKKLKDEFMELVQENDNAPELEKLPPTEFTLDISTSKKLETYSEIRSKIIYLRRRIKNQIRNILSQKIIEKCYKPFEPKLTTIYSFKKNVSFDNFPLPIQDEKAKRKYHCIMLLRRTEIAALRYKVPTNDPNHIKSTSNQDMSLDGARYLSSRSNSLIHLSIEEQDEELIVKDKFKLLYDPLTIITSNRKITQLNIIQDLIYDELNDFNKEFDKMLERKENLIQTINDRNKRIKQIIRLLHLNINDYNNQIFEPISQDNENPESFLNVKDEEIHLKKQINQKVINLENSNELEKDSFAERALKSMMGGKVNMDDMEEAPDDDEPERPEWMDKKKKEDLTEEEQYQIQEFEKKLKNFLEEREKRRKALNAELTKLIKGNISSIEEFDNQMCISYMNRFDVEEKIFYHELEIMHLIEGLNSERKIRTEINDNINEISNELIKQHEKIPKLNELTQLSKQLNESYSVSELNLENLKSQVTKEFKNKDCFNQIIRMFNSISRRIKPKILNGPNIFQQFNQSPNTFIDDLTEIQKNRPTNLPETSWKNFIDYCERKIRYSHESSERQNDLNELKNRLKILENEIQNININIDKLHENQSKLIDELLITLIDIHIPFTFRQGQVEISNDEILIDNNDLILIDKSIIIKLNKLILEAGKKKLDELENMRQQRSNHKILKWEIEKSNVELTNLNEEVKEYQLFRVTKLDQELIMGSTINRNQAEINSLNNGLKHSKDTFEIRMKREKENLKRVQRKINLKKKENDKIEKDILNMQLNLKERKKIYNLKMKSSEDVAEARKSRLKQVMMISRLKRAKKVQENKINKLQEEVNRLRKTVYTSFNDDDMEAMIGYTNEQTE